MVLKLIKKKIIKIIKKTKIIKRNKMNKLKTIKINKIYKMLKMKQVNLLKVKRGVLHKVSNLVKHQRDKILQINLIIVNLINSKTLIFKYLSCKLIKFQLNNNNKKRLFLVKIN